MKYKNNLFNIRSANKKSNYWQGQIGQRNGFCLFVDLKFCIRAALKLLLDTYPYRYRCYTIQNCIYKWCPFGDGDNNPEIYLQNVCKWSGLSPLHQPCLLTKRQLYSLLRAMCRQEQGLYYDFESSFEEAFNLYCHEKEI